MDTNRVPTIYFQHMTTGLLHKPEIVKKINEINPDCIHEIARKYAMISRSDDMNEIGIVRNIDVYHDDIEVDRVELKKLYSDEYINAITATEEDMEKSVVELMNSLFDNKWKTSRIRIMLFRDSTIQDSFHNIIYSIMQRNYNIKTQIQINSQKEVEEFTYIVERK